jgi:hypothetical protein
MCLRNVPNLRGQRREKRVPVRKDEFPTYLSGVLVEDMSYRPKPHSVALLSLGGHPDFEKP